MSEGTASSPESSRASRPKGEWFVSTHWSVVLSATDTSAPGSREALETLCCTYWYPLYAYTRRKGYSPEDAQDLTQGFFARFLEKNYLDDVDRGKGKFRSFLLASLEHFLTNEWRDARAQKRGGGRPLVSLDAALAEDRYRLEPVEPLTPEKVFERRWAFTVLEMAMERLREEYEAQGKAALYAELKSAISSEAEQASYAEKAARLNQTVNAVKMAALRLRRRYRELLRAEVANTLGDESEVDQELRHLLAILSGG